MTAIPFHSVSFSEALRVWWKIALLSFGGPAGQIAVMHRILVEEKRWIGNQRFLHALNYCMLLPGPEAMQLATYIGWLMHGIRGGLAAGILFVLPGVAAIMALSYIYAIYGQTEWLAALFWGLKAAILAIVFQAVIRIGKRVLKTAASQLIAAGAFIAIFFYSVPFPAIILAAAIVGMALFRSGIKAFGEAGHGSGGSGEELEDRDSILGETLPAHAQKTPREMRAITGACLALWLLPVIGLLMFFGENHVFSQIALFFSKLAVVTFGGAYAVLAYMAQAAVEHYGWLKPGEMLDGLGMAETTPGPLIMVTQFVGFMAAFRELGLMAGALGGLLATWVTFAPCFLWIFLGAPYVEKLRHNKLLSASLGAVTAAVVGVVLNLGLWFAVHTLFAQTVPVTAYGTDFNLPVWQTMDVAFLALLLAACVMAFILRFNLFVTLFICMLAGGVYTYV